MRSIKISEVLAILALIVLGVISTSWPVQGGCLRRCKPRPVPVATVRYHYRERGVIQYVPAVEAVAVRPTPQAPAKVAPAPQAPTDPQGFTSWLNATRASYGLPAVSHDENLAAWAGVNNSHQLARGIGHHIMGPARRQNAGWSPAGLPRVNADWMASPGHRDGLLDPTIRTIGIAGTGDYWTFNAQ